MKNKENFLSKPNNKENLWAPHISNTACSLNVLFRCQLFLLLLLLLLTLRNILNKIWILVLQLNFMFNIYLSFSSHTLSTQHF